MSQRNLNQKLHAIYNRIDHIEKAGRNERQKYDFLRSADVLREVRNAFLEMGVWAEPNFDFIGEYQIPTNSGGKMFAARVKATLVLHDIDSDEKRTISGLGDGADSGDKGIYKAQTGAIKNALRNGFLIPDAADPEADETVDKETAPAPRRLAKSEALGAPYDGNLSVAGPPPAQIPDADYADTPPVKVKRVKNVDAPALDMPAHGGTGDELPNESQLDKYRGAVLTLTTDLSAAGLKASRNLPASRKILMYLLKSAGVTEANKISIPQWEAVLEYMKKMQSTEENTTLLIKLINAASKGE